MLPSKQPTETNNSANNVSTEMYTIINKITDNLASTKVKSF